MKKAKFALVVVTLLAITGGALAIKVNRLAKKFYKYTTILSNGRAIGICDELLSTSYLYTTVAAPEGVRITLSALTADHVTTCTAYVIGNG